MSTERLYTPRFWHLCSVHFTGAMALSMFILFPLYVRELGGTELAMGSYAGVASAAAVAVRWPVGWALDRLGRRAVLRTASLLHVVAWGLLALPHQLDARLGGIVLIQGIAGGALFATFFTAANDIIPESRRAEGLAMFGIWGMFPNGLGPAVGEWIIQHHGFPPFFAVAGAFAAASALLAMAVTTPARVSAATSPRTGSTRFPLADLMPLLAITLFFGLAVSSIFTFLAPFVHAHGGGGAGPVFLAYAATAVVVRVVGGHLPDRLGWRRVLLPALACYGAGVAYIAFAGDTAWGVLGGIACGVGHGYAFPILTALVIRRTPSGAYGMALSVFTAMFDLGNTLGGPTFGAVAHRFGYRPMYSIVVGIMAIALLLAARYREPTTRRASADALRQNAHVA